MATSKVYAYGDSGSSMHVSERVPSDCRHEKITGEEALKIYESADFIFVSAFKDGRGKWITSKGNLGHPIPYRSGEGYQYLADECEKSVGRDGLIILFC